RHLLANAVLAHSGVELLVPLVVGHSEFPPLGVLEMAYPERCSETGPYLPRAAFPPLPRICVSVASSRSAVERAGFFFFFFLPPLAREPNSVSWSPTRLRRRFSRARGMSYSGTVASTRRNQTMTIGSSSVRRQPGSPKRTAVSSRQLS